MDCSSCYELFDDVIRIPRNLPCGHTYCQFCLEKMLEINNSIECPSCRVKLDSLLMPCDLSKNFIAADLANKQHELLKKYLVCEKHKEPLMYFCEEDKMEICPKCLINHSGHKFLFQEFSEQAKDKEFKTIDNTFQGFYIKLEKRKEQLKNDLEKIFEKSEKKFEKELEDQSTSNEIFDKIDKTIEDFNEKIKNVTVISETHYIEELKDIEISVKNINLQVDFPNKKCANFPFFISNYNPLPSIDNYGILSTTLKFPKICFFGEKNKVLVYNIEKEEWTMRSIRYIKDFEVNYYSSAVTLPNGDIFLCGGGLSNSAYKICLEKMNVQTKKPMLSYRKEHSSVYLDGFVYAIGGYDIVSQKFLASVERYNQELDEWKEVAPMNVAKCAFAVSTYKNTILCVGGFNEQYFPNENKWIFFPFQLETSLSNSACFIFEDDLLVILGGGSVNGYLLQSIAIDLKTKEYKNFAPLNEGRDIRNKLVCFEGNIFVIGGNSCNGERYCPLKKKWEKICSYSPFLNDNLNSWTCALSYEWDTKLDNIETTDTLHEYFGTNSQNLNVLNNNPLGYGSFGNNWGLRILHDLNERNQLNNSYTFSNNSSNSSIINTSNYNLHNEDYDLSVEPFEM